MGCSNQVEFLRRHAYLVKGPVLEVGSKRYGKSGYDLRQVLPGVEYVGVDLEAGPGVDVIADLSAPITETRAVLGWAGFNTAICFSTLEHCAKPWVVAENIQALLYKGGLLFVSVPFCWKVHEYPKDYWRMTPDGIRVLFPELDFEQHPGTFCTELDGDDMGLNWFGAGHLKIHPMGSKHNYTIPPTLINAIGVKR